MNPLFVTHYTTVNALGCGLESSLEALLRGRSGLRPNDYAPAQLDTWIGRVQEVEEVVLADAVSTFDCRNNRLAWLGLNSDGFLDAVHHASDRYGAHRIAVFMGTSTSGIEETEQAYARSAEGGQRQWTADEYRHTHNPFSLAEFVRTVSGLRGPAMVISTACSSSAKVFAAAARYIETGLVDAAVVGGVDSLCQSTLYGFNSLELLSSRPCRPWDVDRDGISIGEAAGYALLERAAPSPDLPALLGYGESSDAYHMSTPHPEGEGARLAMQQALERAGREAGDVDYINLHGTATPANDRSEDCAITRVFGDRIVCSSTKGWTGHTLGAAGITEAVFSLLALREGIVPGTLNTETLDTALSIKVQRQTARRTLSTVLSNSFGFGGNNCSLLFGAAA